MNTITKIYLQMPLWYLFGMIASLGIILFFNWLWYPIIKEDFFSFQSVTTWGMILFIFPIIGCTMTYYNLLEETEA